MLGRPEDLDCADLSFPALVDDVIARYRVGEGADGFSGLVVDHEVGDVPPVLAHAESLAKVVANLMENSLQAAGETRPLQLGVDWRVDSTSVTLLWTDNGPGLASEVADRLFDLYFSTKSQGTGLGLPICRNLLSRMNGDITLSNRADGSGALVEITLPRADI
jgi:signal transduction histidine kinase